MNYHTKEVHMKQPSDLLFKRDQLCLQTKEIDLQAKEIELCLATLIQLFSIIS